MKEYTRKDIAILSEILGLAEKNAEAEEQYDVSLTHVLKASNQVLPRHDIAPEQDRFYYQCLLRLSMDSEPNWWKKMEKEVTKKDRARRRVRLGPTGYASGPPQKSEVKPYIGISNMPSSLTSGQPKKSNYREKLDWDIDVMNISGNMHVSETRRGYLEKSPAGPQVEADALYRRSSPLPSRSPLIQHVVHSPTHVDEPLRLHQLESHESIHKPRFVDSLEAKHRLENRDAFSDLLVDPQLDWTSDGITRLAKATTLQDTATGYSDFRILSEVFHAWFGVLEPRKSRNYAMKRNPISPLLIQSLFHWISISLSERHDSVKEESKLSRLLYQNPRLRRYVLYKTSVDIPHIHLLCRAVDTFDLWTLDRVFISWSRRTLAEKKLRERSTKRSMANVFVVWKNMMIQARYLRQSLVKNAEQHSFQLQRRSMRCWKKYTFYYLSCQHAQFILERRMKYLIQDRSWNTWRLSFRTNLQCRRMSRVYNRKLCTTNFTLWHRYTLQRRRQTFFKHQACVFLENHLLHKTFAVWLWWKRATRLTEGCYYTLLVQKSMRAWKLFCFRQSLKRQHAMGARQLVVQTGQRKIFQVLVRHARGVKQKVQERARASALWTVRQQRWAVAAWQGWAVHRAERRAGVDHLAQQRVDRTTRGVFQTWTLYAARSSMEDHRTSVLIENNIRKRFFVVWRQCTALRTIHQTLTAARENFCLEESMRIWKAFYHRRRLHCTIIQNAYAKRSKKSIFDMFIAWKRHWHQKQQIHEKAVGLLRNNRINIALQSWNRWARYVLARRHKEKQCLEADIFFNHLIRDKCWVLWRKSYSNHLKLRCFISNKEDTFIKKLFARWKYDTQNLVACKLRASTLFTKQVIRNVQRVFTRWRHYSIRQQCFASTALQLLLRVRKEALKCHWHTWRKQYEYKVAVLSRMDIMLKRIQSRCIGHILHGWKEFHRNQRFLRSFFEKRSRLYQHKLLHASFCRWHDQGQQIAQAVILMEHALCFHQDYLLHRYYIKWVTHFRQSKRQTAIQEKAIEFLLNYSLRSAVDRWKNWSYERINTKNRLQRAFDFLYGSQSAYVFKRWCRYAKNKKHSREGQTLGEQHFLQRCFTTSIHTWFAYTKRAKQKRILNGKIRLKFFKDLLGKVFVSWCYYMKIRRSIVDMKQMTQYYFNYHTRRCIQKWLASARKNRQISFALQVSLVRHQQAQAAQMIVKWKKYLIQKDQAKSVYQKSAEWWTKKHTLSTVQFWRKWTVEIIQYKMHMRQAVSRFRMLFEVQTWEAWLDFVNRKKNMRVLAKKALTTWINNRLIGAVSMWNDYTRAKIAMKAMNKKARSFQTKQMKRKLFNVWDQYIDCRVMKKICTNSGHQRLCQRAMERWRFWTHEEKRLRVFFRLKDQKILCGHFHGWRVAAKKVREEVYELTKRLQLQWQSRTSALMLRSWKATTVFRRRMKKLIILSTKAKTANAWEILRSNTSFLSRLCRMEARIVRQHATCVMASIWQTWRKAYDDLLDLRKKELMAGKYHNSSMKKLVLFQWQNSTKFCQRFRALVSTRRQRMQRRIFKELWLKSTKRKQLAHVSLLVQSHKAHLVCSTLFQVWKYAWMTEEKVRRSLFYYHRKRVQNVWDSWRAYQKSKLESREQIQCWKDRLLLLLHLNRNTRQEAQSHSTKQQRKQELTRLSQCVVLRWKHWMPSKCFQHWHVVAQEILEKKRNLLTALRHLYFKSMHDFFCQWNEYILRRRAEKISAGYWAIKHQAGYFHLWIAYVKDRNHRRFQSTQALDQWASKRLLCMFSRWMKYQRMSTDIFHRVNVLYLAKQFKTKHVVFQNWTTWCLFHKQKVLQTVQAQLHHITALQVKLLRGWAKHVVHLKQVRYRVDCVYEKVQALNLLSHFRAWHEWKKKEKIVQAFMEVSRVSSTRRVQRLIFTAWLIHLRRKKYTRQLVATHYATKIILPKILVAWKEAMSIVKHEKQLEGKLDMFVLLMSDKKVDYFFQRWLAYWTIQKQRSRIVYLYLHGTLLPRIWKAWRKYIHFRSEKDQMKQKVEAYWKNRCLLQCFRTWMAYHQNKQSKQRVLRVGQRKFDFTLLRKCYLAWCTYAWKELNAKRIIENVLRHWRLKWNSLCFREWKSWVVRRKRCKINLVYIPQQRIVQTKLQCWRHWFYQVRMKDLQTRVITRRFFTKWCIHRLLYQRKRDILGMVHRCWAQRSQFHLFTRWKESAKQQVQERKKIAAAFVYSKTHTMTGAFNTWKEFVVTRHVLHEKALLVQRHVVQRLKVMVFTAMKTYAKEMKKRIIMVHNVKQVLVRNSLKGALATLHAFVLMRKRDNLHAESAQAFYRHSMHQKIVQHWRARVRMEKETLVQIQRQLEKKAWKMRRRGVAQWKGFTTTSVHVKWAVHFFSRSIHQRCFALLKKHAARQRKIRQGRAQHYFRCKRTTLLHWRDQVERGKVKRQIQCHERMTQERSFSQWRQQSTQSRRLKAFCIRVQAKERRSWIATVFKKWKTYSKATRWCRTQLNKASRMMIVQRMSQWKAFTHYSLRCRMAYAIIAQPFHLLFYWKSWKKVFVASFHDRLRRLSPCFGHLKQRAQTKRAQKLLSRMAWKAMKLCKLRRILSAWNYYVEVTRQYRATLIHERENWMVMQRDLVRQEQLFMKRHWQAWRDSFLVGMYMAMSAAKYHRAKIVSIVWHRWVRFRFLESERKKTWKKAVGFHSRGLFRRSFQAWYQAILQKQDKDRLHERARHRGNVRWKRMFLSRWKINLAWSIKLEKLRRRCESRRLNDAFFTWKEFCQKRMFLNECREQLELKRIEAALKGGIRKWCTFTVKRWKEKQNGLLASVFAFKHKKINVLRAWRWGVGNYIERQLRYQQALQVMVEYKKRESVQKWYQTVREEINVRKSNGLARNHVYQRVLLGWKDWFNTRLAHRFHAISRNEGTRKRILAWRAHAVARQQQRNVLNDALIHKERRDLLQSIYTWKSRCDHFVSHRRQTQRAFQLYRSCLQRRWMAWHQRAQKSRKQQDRKAALHYHESGKRKSWHRWRSWYIEFKTRQQRQTREALALKKKQFIRRVHGWFKAWAFLAQRRNLLRNWLYQSELCLLSRMFLGWKQRAKQSVAKKAQQGKAWLYYLRRLQHIVLFHWRTFTYVANHVPTLQRPWQRPFPFLSMDLHLASVGSPWGREVHCPISPRHEVLDRRRVFEDKYVDETARGLRCSMVGR